MNTPPPADNPVITDEFKRAAIDPSVPVQRCSVCTLPIVPLSEPDGRRVVCSPLCLIFPEAGRRASVEAIELLRAQAAALVNHTPPSSDAEQAAQALESLATDPEATARRLQSRGVLAFYEPLSDGAAALIRSLLEGRALSLTPDALRRDLLNAAASLRKGSLVNPTPPPPPPPPA